MGEYIANRAAYQIRNYINNGLLKEIKKLLLKMVFF